MVRHGHHRHPVLSPVVNQPLNHRLPAPRFQGHVRGDDPVAIESGNCVATNGGAPIGLVPGEGDYRWGDLLPGDVSGGEGGGEGVVPSCRRRPIGSRASEGVAVVTGRLSNGRTIRVATGHVKCTNWRRWAVGHIPWTYIDVQH